MICLSVPPEHTPSHLRVETEYTKAKTCNTILLDIVYILYTRFRLTKSVTNPALLVRIMLHMPLCLQTQAQHFTYAKDTPYLKQPYANNAASVYVAMQRTVSCAARRIAPTPAHSPHRMLRCSQHRQGRQVAKKHNV